MTSVMGAYFRTPRVQIAAFLYFLIAGVLTQVPLFNYLGYEFSALMTIPTSLISGIITIQFLREHQIKPLHRRTWLFVVLDYFHVNFLLLLIPLMVMSFNALAVKNCNFIKGISYYELLPYCAMFFSVSLALVAGTLFRKAIVIFCLVIAAILFHVLVVTYTQPQLFAYNFILGFFPGITYDETLSDTNTLLLYRGFTIIASLMFIALFAILVSRFNVKENLRRNIQSIKRHFESDKKLWLIAAFCFAILFVGHLYRDKLGYEYTAVDIQQALGRRSESEHFIFYYSKKDFAIDEIVRMKAESEFHFAKVASTLHLRNTNKKKISVYIYSSGESKRKFIGTSTTNVAKPWRNEIHLTKTTFASTFRHELVHVLAADFGFPILHASTRIGLNEGLAVAVDWDEGIFTPHQYAAALQREKLLGDVGALFSLSGFAMQSSSYAYIVSGSFCKYLIERFGIQRFKRSFPNGNFVLVYGESLESLIKDWKVFLRTIDAGAIPPATVQAMFLHPSIFYKTCAREVAEQNDRAVKAVRVSNFPLAEAEFAASYENAPTVYALHGLFHTYIVQKKFEVVVEKYSSLPEQSLLKVSPALMLQVGDAYFFSGQNDNALHFYKTVREMNYSQHYIELSMLRIHFVKENCSPDLLFTLHYHNASDSLKRALLLAKHTLERASLLYYKAMYAEQGSDERVNALLAAFNIADEMDMKYFSLVRIAESLYKQNRFEEAKMYYWNAKNYSLTPVVLEYLNERIELCEMLQNELQY